MRIFTIDSSGMCVVFAKLKRIKEPYSTYSYITLACAEMEQTCQRSFDLNSSLEPFGSTINFNLNLLLKKLN